MRAKRLFKLAKNLPTTIPDFVKRAFGKSWKKGRGRQVAISATCLVLVGVLVLTQFLRPKSAQAQILSQGPNSAAATGDCTNDASAGTVAWTSPGDSFSNNTTYATATGLDGTTSNYIKCMNFGFTIPTAATIVGVVVGVERKSNSTNNGGSNDASVLLVKAGTPGGTNRATTTTYTTADVYEDHGGQTDLWGNTLTPSDVNASNFGVAFAATKPNTAGSAHNITVDHIRITVYYEHHTIMTATGYIWENDDEDQVAGDAYDENTQQEAGNTPITNVAQGERVTLRMQIKNTGTAPIDNNLALFFDRGDGVWTKVKNTNPTTAGGTGCVSTDYSCTTIDGIGNYTSIALDSDGNPWLAYGDVNSLRVARYVGSGGNCDDTGGSDAWQCTVVNNAGAGGGTYPSIAISSSGIPWISFKDQVNDNLKVASYVGSGGTGCADAAWTCTLIDATNDVGTESSIAIDPSGTPWIAHRDFTDTSFKVARYVGSGGNCDDTGGSDAWQCTGVDTANFVGYEPHIAIGPTGTPWVSYAYNINDLRVARYVGSGGTGCADAAWTCTTVESSGDIGNDSAIDFDPAGNPWISHRDIANNDLRIARYVGSGGTGCASSAWTDCGVVDGTGDVGQNLSMVFGPGGNAVISYYDVTETNLKLAAYVGSGGNCDDTGGSDAWQCAVIDSTDNVGDNSSLAVDASGSLWISYYDTTNTNTKIAKLSSRMGEITISPSSAALNGNAINESHADMTSVSDTGNRDDADCIGGGTWNNGKVAISEEIGSLGLPVGNSTPQCTEVAFVIDTSQAVSGTTYRFALASRDAWRPDKGVWRGGLIGGVYPTLTIGSSASVRITKDVLPKIADCTNTDWGCQQVEDPGWSGITSTTIDNNGNPWVASADSTNNTLRVARYLGGATTGTGCGINTWTCVILESSGSADTYAPSMTTSPDGNPWISYFDPITGWLKVARYLGGATTGTGCFTGNTWTCEIVDNSGLVGTGSSLAFDQYGTAWISYHDQTSGDLKLARYSSSGGTGCYSAAWTCTTIVSTNIVGVYTSIAFDSKNNPWIAYMEGATTSCNDSPTTECSLAIARFVGSGGTGCAVSSWTCVIIDNPTTTSTAGEYASIAIDSNDKVWISYLATSSGLKVAEYLGGATTGTGCSVNTWNCTGIYTLAGGRPRMALDSEGKPWVAYYRTGLNDTHVARYLGADITTGTGCTVQSWNCEVIMTSGDMGNGTSIAFDYSGTPWIATRNNSNGSLWVMRRHLSPVKLGTKSANNYWNANAPRADGRYRLSAGLSPRSTSTCAGTADFLGLCGVASDDSNFDSITGTNSRLMFSAALKNSSPASVPTITWIGRSNVAPSTGGTTGDLVLQVYNHTTRTWETVATDSASTDCNTVDCSLSGSVPDVQQYSYYEGDSTGSYWLSIRVWQYENTSAETLKTDVFSAVFENTGTKMRHGGSFIDSQESGFDL